MQHPDEGTIHAWLDGALSADEGRAIEAHLAECTACRDAVVEARGLIAGATRILLALDAVPGGVLPAAVPVAGREPAPIRRTPLWRSTGWRAAAAIVVVGSVSWLVTRSTAPADVSTTLPVAVSVAPADGATAGRMEAAPAPPSIAVPNATPPATASTNAISSGPTTPNAPTRAAVSRNSERPGTLVRANRLAAEVAAKAVSRAAPTRELARASAADAPAREQRSSVAAGGQVAVDAAAPNVPAAGSSASPAPAMLNETVVTMGKASGSSAPASVREKSPPLTGCYALETLPASYAMRGETSAPALLPTRLELIDTGTGRSAGRGTVLASPPAAAAASRLRGEWTSLGANLLELRIDDGAGSVRATLSVAGDSVTGQAHADSGTVADRRPSAVKGRRTSCKVP